MRHRPLHTTKLTFLLLAFVTTPTFVWAWSLCSPTGYTILTINGIWTDEAEAKQNRDALSRFIKGYKNEKVAVDYLHNASHLGGLGDIIKSAEQGLFDRETIDDYDLTEMLRDASEKVTTRKLLLVAHSQGNFYANGFYDTVVGKDGGLSAEAAQASVPAESIGVYSVATPSGRVAGGGKHLTSDTDKVIAGLVGRGLGRPIMEPNAHIELKDDDDALGHNFAGVYLKYKGAEIVGGIEDALGRLKAGEVEEVEPQSSLGEAQPRPSSGPCINPPKLGLGHTIKGAAFAVADPLANAARVAAAGAAKGVNAVGLAAVRAAGAVAAGISSAFRSDSGQAAGAALAGAGNGSVLTVSEQSVASSDGASDSVPAAAQRAEGAAVTVQKSTVGEHPAAPPDSSAPAAPAAAEARREAAATELPVPPTPPVSHPPAPPQESSPFFRLSPPGGGGGGVSNAPARDSAADNSRTAQSAADSSAAASADSSSISSSSAQNSTGGDNTAPAASAASSTPTASSTPAASASEVAADTAAPVAPEISSPARGAVFTVQNITFTGFAEVGSTISTDFSSATTSVSASAAPGAAGEWTLSLALPQGESAILFYATDAAGNRSAPASTTVFVDSIGPDVSLSSATCADSLAASPESCLVATTTLRFSWMSGAGDLAYFILDQNGAAATTSATSTAVSAADRAAYVFSVSAVDAAGNVSATSTKSVSVQTMPVVMNEVAWAGTAASGADEWIELYNNIGETVSLNNIFLFAADLSPYLNLSGYEIPAHSYFLIERKNSGETDEAAQSSVKDIPADLWASFGNGLNNNGENLQLAYVSVSGAASSAATTTLDAAAACPPQRGTTWCKGSDSSYATMERYDSLSSGALSSNWETHLGEFIQNGRDAQNSFIKGTPKSRNSASYLIAPPGGAVSANKTLTRADSPYLVPRAGLSVGSGATLTLEAGTVVKIVSPNAPQIEAGGTIVAEGTAENPVVFTSFDDDEYGGDLNANGAASAPAAGSWKRIFIKPESVGSSFAHTMVRYGGGVNLSDTAGKRGAVGVEGAAVSFSHLVVEKSGAHGLALQNSSSAVSDSRFSSSTNALFPSAGIFISGGSPTVSGSIFSGNYRGARVEGAVPIFTGNSFTSSVESAVSVSGPAGTFRGNTGSGNGTNAIVLNGGTIAQNGTTTLSANPLPYLLKNKSTVAGGATLAFEPGTVVKGYLNNGGAVGWLEVGSGGSLYSGGSSPSDILFTSVRDASAAAGGVTENLGGSAAPGDWVGITVLAGGRVELNGFTIKYGGQRAGSGFPVLGAAAGALQITGSAAAGSGSLSHGLFESNFQSGLNLKEVSGFSASAVTFQNHTAKQTGNAAAIYANNSSASFSGITFSGNSYDGVGVGQNALSCQNCGSPNTTPAVLFSP